MLRLVIEIFLKISEFIRIFSRKCAKKRIFCEKGGGGICPSPSSGGLGVNSVCAGSTIFMEIFVGGGGADGG
jgi:hypothetical protein